ncbi:MAG TPA: hypothetical protein VLC10_00720 [Patescibacteria group bacterium]|nr:hypothetical protein [Patescibacteria group bacterium]
MSFTLLFAYGETAFHVLLAAGALAALRVLGLRRWRTVLRAVGAVKLVQEAAAVVASLLLDRPVEHPAETAAWAVIGLVAIVLAAGREPVRVRADR